MKALHKILTLVVFPAIIIVLGYLLVASIMKPVRFEQEVDKRKDVAVERLKAIRTLEVAFKGENGKFTASLDSLIDFYNNGQMTVIRQIGSMDDSLAVAQKRVRRDTMKVAIKDTLFNDQPNFIVDSIKYIPFANGKEITLEAVVKTVSGVNVPLFEGTISYDDLLRGLDRQLIINLKAAQEDLGRYTGLKVGSVTTPNNNAGNWE
jgi:hypothetical protein